jgi:hypothetical protein
MGRVQWMSQMWESGVKCLMRAGQMLTMRSDPGAYPSSLRTWKTGLINTSGQTGISLLMKFMRNFLKFLIRWFMKLLWSIDCLCGLVVRVSGYRSRGPGLDFRHFQIFWEAVGLERGPLSLVSTREYNWGATWKK